MDMYQKREMRKNKKMDENTKSLPSTSINWYPGHMAKALREIKETLKLIDIVLVILDARVPYSSLNKDVYELLKTKTVIIVFNKSDLANISMLNNAEAKYKKEGCYTVRTNSLTGDGIEKLITLIKELGKKIKYNKKTSDSYKMLKPVYRVMVTGIPNVGKSSVINKMCGKKSAEVGNKPGVTRKLQWLKAGREIEIMDTPGLLSKSLKEEGMGEKLAIAGTIKEEILDEEMLAFTLINILLSNDVYTAMFKDRYKLECDTDSMTETEILEALGRKRGALLKGDVVDTTKASRILLEDYRSGKIGKISLE